MVPPDRIELSASPLPMARSTPELRRLDLTFEKIRFEGAHNGIGFVSLQASLDEVLLSRRRVPAQ